LFATVEDLARFVAAGMTGPGGDAGDAVLDPEIRQALYSPVAAVGGMFGVVADGYALGHFVETYPSGRFAVFHGGQGLGWMTHFHAVPETGDGIVLLANSQRSWPFFAHVLSDWAAWNGVPAVRMGRIVPATMTLRGVIILLVVLSVTQAWRIGHGLRSGRRRFAPLAPRSRPLRVVQMVLFTVLAGGLWWSVNQEYLFVSSIFPTLYVWLAAALAVVAAASLMTALCPSLCPETTYTRPRGTGGWREPSCDVGSDHHSCYAGIPGRIQALRRKPRQPGFR
jgi:hypothetical protein